MTTGIILTGYVHSLVNNKKLLNTYPLLQTFISHINDTVQKIKTSEPHLLKIEKQQCAARALHFQTLIKECEEKNPQRRCKMVTTSFLDCLSTGEVFRAVPEHSAANTPKP